MIKESFSVSSKTLRHCNAVGAVSCNGSVRVKLITSPLALLILTSACLNSTVVCFNILSTYGTLSKKANHFYCIITSFLCLIPYPFSRKDSATMLENKVGGGNFQYHF